MPLKRRLLSIDCAGPAVPENTGHHLAVPANRPLPHQQALHCPHANRPYRTLAEPARRRVLRRRSTATGASHTGCLVLSVHSDPTVETHTSTRTRSACRNVATHSGTQHGNLGNKAKASPIIYSCSRPGTGRTTLRISRAFNSFWYPGSAYCG